MAVFLTLPVGVGRLKVSIVHVAQKADFDADVRRRIAIRAVGVDALDMGILRTTSSTTQC